MLKGGGNSLKPIETGKSGGPAPSKKMSTSGVAGFQDTMESMRVGDKDSAYDNPLYQFIAKWVKRGVNFFLSRVNRS